MNKLHLTCFILLVSCVHVKAQNANDTATYPYWISMMQNPSVNFYRTRSAFETYWAGRPIEKGSGWKVYKRWEWLASKIIDSLGNFPDAGLQLSGHEDMLERDRSYWDMVKPGLGPGTVPCKTQGDWKEMGPVSIPTNNTGQINGMGRLNAVALHPSDTNTIFVGSAAGGIWKSTNGGSSWAVNTDVLPTLGVSAIAIDPNNPSVMYFGSGDRDASDAAGFGVFKSSNGGGSWAISNTGMGNRTVSRIVIDPSNTSVLLAACNGGIYRSTNNGVNWTQTFSGGFFKDIIFKPGNSSIAYASNGGSFYRSANNGQSWTQITSGLPTTSVSRISIDVNALDHKLVYLWIANGSVNRGFYLSRDSGTTFRTMSTSPNIHDYSTNGSGGGGQAWYNMDMVTDPANAGIVYCGGVNVFRSSDTGKTWTIAGYWVNQIHADQHELVASPITNRIYAANDGGLYASRNRGASWTPLKSGLAIAQIYKLGAARLQKDILINGYQDNGTANYRNGWYTTRGGDGMDCEVDQTDPRYSYGELYYGSVFRVFNTGTQATIAQQGYTAAGSDTINESGGWVTPITLKEGSGNTMFIGYKNIWRSNNIRANPVTWRKISNNLGGTNGSNFTEIENCIANPDILYASRSNGTFYRSDDVNAATPTWTAVTQPVAGVINAIETDPKNQNVVYIGIGTRVYRSTNKGSSWTQVATNHAYNVSAILLDTSSALKSIYVGTMGGGVWYSDTSINVWRNFSTGLPNTVRVTDLEMYYEPQKGCNCNVLYGSTYNRGNWYSSIYNDGSKKPVALLESYDTVICKTTQLRFKDKSCFAPGRFKWTFAPAGASFVSGTDSMSQNPVLSFSTAGKYTFKFMAENCNGVDTLAGVVYVGDSVRSSCIPTTSNNVNGLGIYNVSMAGLIRSSEGRTQEGPYVNLACSKVFKVKRGGKYLLQVSTGALNTEQVKAFIDFNNNGSLSDAGELVYQPAPALPNHSDTVRIPMNAVSGTILRMRIRSDFSSIGSNPCSTLSYGQTEDYGLYIEADDFIPRFVAGSDSVCSGSSVLFSDSTAYNGLNYSWQFGAGSYPATASGKGPHIVVYSSPGHKTVRLTIDGKTSIRDSAVYIHQVPAIGIGITAGDSSICAGRGFTLTLSDANASSASYKWFLNRSLIADSMRSAYSKPAAYAADSGMYMAVASTAYCADTAFRTIHIRPLPEAAFNINDSAQCLRGNAFDFTSAAQISSGSFSAYWFFGDAASDSGLTASHSYANSGNYSVRMLTVSAYGCRDSAFKSLQVHVHPQAGFTVSPEAQCFKDNQFGFTNTGSISSGSFSSSWDFGNGSGFNGLNPPAIRYSVFDSSYTVQLLLISTQGCRDSIRRSLKLYDMPVSRFGISDTAVCFKNHRFVLSDQGSIANGSYSSTWDFGDGSGSNQSNPVHSYQVFGSYDIVQRLLSNRGCSASSIQRVNVYEQAALRFSVNDSSQCLKGNEFRFNNLSNIGAGLLKYTWSFGDGNSDTASNPVKRYLSAGLYNVMLGSVTDFSCRDTVYMPLRVFHQTAADFTVNNSSQCFKGNLFTFANLSNIGSGSFSSDWSFGDGSSSNAFNPPVKSYAAYADSLKVNLFTRSDNNCLDSVQKTMYLLASPYPSMTASDTAMCLKGNTFSFSNTGNSNKGGFVTDWFLGDGNTRQSTNVSHRYASAGTYKLKMHMRTMAGCSDSLFKTIVLHPNAMPAFSINDSTQCEKAQRFDFTENGSISSGTYTTEWQFGDGNSGSGKSVSKRYNINGIYTVKLFLTSDKLCKDTLEKSVTVYESPQAVIALDDSMLCFSGNLFRYTDASIASVPYSRLWYAPVLRNQHPQSDTASFSDTGYFRIRLEIISNAFCADTAERTVYVAPMPVFDLAGRSEVCLNDTLTLRAISHMPLNYSWQINTQAAGNGNSLQFPSAVPGRYDIVINAVSDIGCQTGKTYSNRVEVHKLPLILFDYSKEAQQNGALITFKDQGNNRTLSRLWQFSNGQSGAGSTESIFIEDTASIRVTLRVTDSNNCTNSGSETIFFSIPNAFYVPSVFSPNGDGVNDVFKMEGYLRFARYSMRIYNRWGALVFESTDAGRGWDGRYQDRYVPDGGYLYTIDFEDFEGQKTGRKGTVMLLR